MAVDISMLDRLESDDINVAAPDQYVDGGQNQLLPEGTYDLIITSFEVITPKDDPTQFRGFNLTELVVASGPLEGRRLFQQRVWATPYMRNGVKVSGLGDLLRAIDQEAEWDGPRGAGELLQKAQDQRIPFRVKVGWEAFDQIYYDEKGGPLMEKKSPEQKSLRKEATVKGMRNFRQTPDGTYLPEVTGPSGELLEGRLAFNNFIPSGKRR
jgi:hypothetical protein